MAVINLGLTTTVSSVYHVVLASLPVFVLLVYYLVRAFQRSSERCYTDPGAAQRIESLCSLVPLEDMISVFMGAGFMWMMLSMYLTVYMPRFRALVKQYMDEGETILGDVHYRSKGHWCNPVAHGHVLYAHPNYKKIPIHIYRQVRVFERYTREKVALVVLRDMPFSALPKEETDVTLQILRRNESRLEACKWISWWLVLFSYVGPICILKIQYDLEDLGLYYYQPDYYGKRVVPYFILFGGIVFPLLSYAIIYMAWKRHEYWTTEQHRVWGEKEGEDDNSVPSWFDEEQFQRPPSGTKQKRTRVYRPPGQHE